MAKLTLFHGSDHIIKVPNLAAGKETNDYGRGFYCTRLLEMAKEWAAKTTSMVLPTSTDLTTTE